MNTNATHSSTPSAPLVMDPQLDRRHRRGLIGRVIFMASIGVAILALFALLYNIFNQSFGLVIYVSKIQPDTLASVPLDELSRDELVEILEANVSAGLFRRFESEVPMAERSQADVLELVLERVVEPEIVEVHGLQDSLLNQREILANAAEKYDRPSYEFRSWVSPNFITSPQSNEPQFAGIRTAVLGSLWVIAITIATSFPIGVGAAVYLEEYASDNWLNRIIQTNINNLAGVPSIIYGILGLAIFVRLLEPLTSGAAFGVLESGTTANGRTILSAGLTLALLVLPLIIINAQEAIRAKPAMAWGRPNGRRFGTMSCPLLCRVFSREPFWPCRVPWARRLRWWWWGLPRLFPWTPAALFPNLPPCPSKFTSGLHGRKNPSASSRGRPSSS